jgi:hypothetical protein
MPMLQGNRLNSKFNPLPLQMYYRCRFNFNDYFGNTSYIFSVSLTVHYFQEFSIVVCCGGYLASGKRNVCGYTELGKYCGTL